MAQQVPQSMPTQQGSPSIQNQQAQNQPQPQQGPFPGLENQEGIMDILKRKFKEVTGNRQFDPYTMNRFGGGMMGLGGAMMPGGMIPPVMMAGMPMPTYMNQNMMGLQNSLTGGNDLEEMMLQQQQQQQMQQMLQLQQLQQLPQQQQQQALMMAMMMMGGAAAGGGGANMGMYGQQQNPMYQNMLMNAMGANAMGAGTNMMMNNNMMQQQMMMNNPYQQQQQQQAMMNYPNNSMYGQTPFMPNYGGGAVNRLNYGGYGNNRYGNSTYGNYSNNGYNDYSPSYYYGSGSTPYASTGYQRGGFDRYGYNDPYDSYQSKRGGYF